ncbi:MAG: ABC-2 family transporter protein [Treponema sp.]|nr:ABC-2 family transporter protein [Treponema sp.]
MRLKPYAALFRIRFVNSLQYRSAAIAGLATQFAWGFMYILAFAAFYRENPEAFPMTFQQTVSYIWLQQAFMTLFFIWFWETGIIESVESGGIAYDLVRPMDMWGRWLATITANRIARCALRSLPIVVVALVLPEPFRLALPADPARLALFFLSMIMTLGVVAAFSIILYTTAFYTINSLGTRLVVSIASEFLSGGYIPVPFFPEALRRVVELSPFGAMQNMPLLIFSGYLDGTGLARGLGLQAFWLVALVVLGRLFLARSLRRVVAQGG